jgi:hypothetical protein
VRGSLHCTNEKEKKWNQFIYIHMYMDTLTSQLKNGLLPPTQLI